jgi:hypothetical protein
MPDGVVCPIDGTQLILVSSTNLVGDPIRRWECPVDDWAGPWYSKNQPLPELLRDVKFIGNAMPLTISDLAILPVHLLDDCESFEAFRQEIDGGIDTTFTFTQVVRLVRISNWNVATRILVKDGPISSNTDLAAARIGRAYKSNVPRQLWFPFVTSTIHLRAAVTSEVTVEGYFGNA